MRKLLLCALAVTGCAKIDTGEIGIAKRFGEVVGEPLTPGLHFYNPITSDIVTLDVREQKHQDLTQCFTRDTQNAGITYATNFELNPSAAIALYKALGEDWERKAVLPVVEASLKNVVGQYAADDMISKRSALASQALEAMKVALAPRGVTVKSFALVNIDFEDTYEKAVEAKQVAKQRAEEEKNKTLEVEERAKQKIISAEAEARSMKIRSDALTQNRSLVEYEAVQKWDGKLPQYMLGNSVPFVNFEGKK